MTHMQVDELERSRFFGSLELKFEAGQVVLLRKTDVGAAELLTYWQLLSEKHDPRRLCFRFMDSEPKDERS